jgi:hypothetical protein
MPLRALEIWPKDGLEKGLFKCIIYVDDPTLGLWLFFDALIIFHLSGGSDIAFLWSTNMHADFNDHILFNWASTLVLLYFDDFSLTNCLPYVSYPIQDVEQSWYWWFIFIFIFIFKTYRY